MPSLKDIAKEAKTKKPAKVKPAKKPSPEFTLSSEYIQESDEDEDEDESSGAEPASNNKSLLRKPSTENPKINGTVKVPLPDSSSSSESPSDKNETSEESSSEESEEEDEPNERAKKTSAPERQKQTPKQSNENVVSLEETTPYNPPPGFEAASINGSSQVSEIFKKSNLDGKQIWYIIAPAAVPLSAVKKISLRDIKSGRKVVSHNGDDYMFTEEAPDSTENTKVMVPNASKGEYRTLSSSIHRTLHLQQLPVATSAFQPTVAARKSVRPQPKGLKMRFRPIGFGNGNMGKIGSSSDDESSTDSDSNEEMADSVPENFRKPMSLSSDEPGSNSSEESDSDVEMTEAPVTVPKTTVKPNLMVTESNDADRSLKRKHAGNGDIESKNNSSESTKADDRNPKRIKKNRAKSQETVADNQLASIKGNNIPGMPPPRTSISISHIPPTSKTPKSNTAPQSSSQSSYKTTHVPPPRLQSPHQIVPTPPPSSILKSSQVSQANSMLSRKAASVSEDRPSLAEQIRRTNPALSEEQRNNEIKRLKKGELKRLSKLKRRDLIASSPDVEDETTSNPSAAASLINRHEAGISTSDLPTSSAQLKPLERKDQKERKKREKELVMTNGDNDEGHSIPPKPRDKEDKVKREMGERKKRKKEAVKTNGTGKEDAKLQIPRSTSAILPPKLTSGH